MFLSESEHKLQLEDVVRSYNQDDDDADTASGIDEAGGGAEVQKGDKMK